MKPKLIVTILIILFAHTSYSQESATRYLMNQPTSMLDFGLYRIQTNLSSLDLNRSKELAKFIQYFDSYAFASYRYDDDYISVTFHANGYGKIADKDEIKKALETTCSALYWFAAERIKKVDVRGISGNFLHNGYKLNSEPANLEDELKKKVSLKTVVTYVAGQLPDEQVAQDGYTLSCSAPISESTLTYSAMEPKLVFWNAFHGSP